MKKALLALTLVGFAAPVFAEDAPPAAEKPMKEKKAKKAKKDKEAPPAAGADKKM